MKLLFDFFPIILFFVAYKLFNIYIATAVAMAAALLQTGGYWAKHRRFEVTHIISLVIILFLGGATLLSHDIMFIKWKPTAVYWILALIFLISHFIGNKSLIQRMLGDKIELPHSTWQKLNWSWIGFFTLMGVANLYVVYNFSTNTWVDFKLFGTLGLTVLFVVIQSIFMAKYIKS